MEIMVTGRKFSFEEAREMSLVHDIWDGGIDDFHQDIIDYAGQFTLPMAASKAIGNIKRSVQSGMEIPLEYHLALERELQSISFRARMQRKVSRPMWKRRRLGSRESSPAQTIVLVRRNL